MRVGTRLLFLVSSLSAVLAATLSTIIVTSTNPAGVVVTLTSISTVTPAAAAAAATTGPTVVTTTNAAGAVITSTVTPATGNVVTTTDAAGNVITTTAAGVTATGTTPAASVITTTNAAGAVITSTLAPSSSYSVITTTNAAGAVITSTVTGPASGSASSTASVVTTTNAAGAVIVSTISGSSSSSSSASASSVSSVSSSSSSLTTAAAVVANPNGRPDPSTSQTQLPLSPVTTLSVASFVTITEGTTTYTTTRGPTVIWVTLTRSGQVLTVSTTFAQRFASQFSTTAQPSSGSIGLGTISGEVGYVKSTQYLTITNGGNSNRISMASGFLAFLLWLI
ncbi:LAMI_0G06634g1_1 [Lachancea mirantina]|uniref:LAMI_0G06634g1_1 n=1 Tax=Lachancea mirantina TaxID=1230905 RepID=A0A1G4K9C0_9SACH|nr:LAMI_0G06634g1_1 [Lachancea mirantina]